MQSQFDWTRAEQLGLLERAVLPKQPGVSAVAMKSILKAIDGYGRGREAWPGYDTLATSAGVSVATAKRAVKSLVRLSLLCVERRGPRTLNHYRLVWSELALLDGSYRRQTVDESPRSNERSYGGKRSVTAAERSVTAAERSVMVTLPKCHGDTLTDKKRQEETTTTQQQPVVVVSLCGVVKAEEAVGRAVALGMSSGDIRERVEAYRRLPIDQQRPGVLYNWLTRSGSYRPAAKVAELPQLRLAKLPTNAAEIERAELIRYGRRQQWSHERLQQAVSQFEQARCDGVAVLP